MNKRYTIDNQWMAALPPSAQAYLKIWEESVVALDFDPLLKQCKITGATTAEGFLDKQPPKDRLDAIYENLLQESGGRPKAPRGLTCRAANAQHSSVGSKLRLQTAVPHMTTC